MLKILDAIQGPEIFSCLPGRFFSTRVRQFYRLRTIHPNDSFDATSNVKYHSEDNGAITRIELPVARTRRATRRVYSVCIMKLPYLRYSETKQLFPRKLRFSRSFPFSPSV